ncbi:MAG: hydroxymethylbilane synthase [Pseudomonadota bacterium]
MTKIMEQIIKIGARGSPLSLAQTRGLRAELAAALGIEQAEIEARLPIIPIITQGDKIQDRALLEAGGKGLFTKELDEAMLDGRIDCAIHSMKDVPTVLPEGIVLLGCPKREDRRDALITTNGLNIEQLPIGATLGTASLRRSAQFLRARPDLKIGLLRGNVGTRLAKIESGEFDATILAIAGLRRLGLGDTKHHLIDPDEMPPAIGQGALAITARNGDEKLASAFAKIHDIATTIEVAAERGFLRALDGSCRTPIAALAIYENGFLEFAGELLSDDGKQVWRAKNSLHNPDVNSAAALGRELGLQIKAEAAK